MAALPSAFDIHVSQPLTRLWPWSAIAKSTIEVVPPHAAAMVPVSKSSALVAPPNGMSRWVWTSIPPGMTSLFSASITVSASIAIEVPIISTRSPRHSTSPL